MQPDDKFAKAAGLLLHSPPGEVDDVFNDIRGIVNDDAALQEHIEPILAESNTQQFYIAELKNSQSKVLLTPYNQVKTNEFIDPNTRTQFSFDHLHRTVIEEWEVQSDEAQQDEELRKALQQQVDGYVSKHYPSGCATVFLHEAAVVTCIVSNRFSPSNFWNGSWRSVWSFDASSGQLNGSVKVKVHYFEDGNVQLDTQTDFSADISKQDGETEEKVAERVAKVIKEYEAQFQQSIADGYRQLSERTFKGLRRMLPLTRSKVDWEKLANYKIGGELANAES
ncbi:F-actin-capping protein subunit alpha [Coemansia brasiliensis]|uniref:F-actin-capping protein subunit alpha n=1 Tax=Coemansia brasiliensis TaxID=2650707 RepID=A0A9W8ICW7_9FUNG|nr:F-actin-capping protein subunit alpha [Coemansia brasiliensis]